MTSSIKTKVINGTDVEIELKQGSAGIFSTLCTLKPSGTKNNSYTVDLPSNTTYREYWCVQQPGPTEDVPRVIFSSDDCAEFLEVEVLEYPNGSKSYTWRGTVPRDKVLRAEKLREEKMKAKMEAKKSRDEKLREEKLKDKVQGDGTGQADGTEQGDGTGQAKGTGYPLFKKVLGWVLNK